MWKKNQSWKNLAEFQAYNPIRDSSIQIVSPKVLFFITRGRRAEYQSWTVLQVHWQLFGTSSTGISSTEYLKYF